MTERGLPGDGAPACPFVAFGDDREGRATSPDHRHRCFAESPPAPRALAHQEAYCLSSAFPVCPTFQDWARREAAHARGAGERAETAPSAAPMAAAGLAGAAAAGAAGAAALDAEASHAPDGAESGLPTGDHLRGEAGPSDLPVRRNPPRDWAAPPPWAGGIGAASGGVPRTAGVPDTSDLLATRAIEGHGLAGSAADRLAGGPPPPSAGPDPSTGPDVALPAGGAAAPWSASASGSASAAPDDELAGLVQRRPPPLPAFDPLPARSARRQAVSATKTGAAIPGPSWERLHRAEAYPAIRSRSAMPGLPRVAVLAGALVIAAIALFMLPALLGVGGSKPSGSASPTSSLVATATPGISTAPVASQQIYIIKNKDTLSKVARMFGITLAELLAANPAIKNPDKVSLGQQIIIPAPSGGAASPSASP